MKDRMLLAALGCCFALAFAEAVTLTGTARAMCVGAAVVVLAATVLVLRRRR